MEVSKERITLLSVNVQNISFIYYYVKNVNRTTSFFSQQHVNSTVTFLTFILME